MIETCESLINPFKSSKNGHVNALSQVFCDVRGSIFIIINFDITIPYKFYVSLYYAISRVHIIWFSITQPLQQVGQGKILNRPTMTIARLIVCIVIVVPQLMFNRLLFFLLNKPNSAWLFVLFINNQYLTYL